MITDDFDAMTQQPRTDYTAPKVTAVTPVGEVLIGDTWPGGGGYGSGSY